ncbi:MAG: ATP-binding protein [bacterium]
MNITDREHDVYPSKEPRQALKDLLRLAETKLDLVWRFEAGEEITSLCVAHYTRHGEQQNQVIVGSKDSCVYSLSIHKELLWKFCAQDEVMALCTSDLTDDGSEEIIVGSKDHHIYVLSAEGCLVGDYLCEGPVKAVAVAKSEQGFSIIAGSSNGYIYFFDYRDGIRWKYFCGDHCRVNGLCVASLGDASDSVIAITSKGDVIILDYHEKKLLRRVTKPGSLYAVIAQDIDNDGVKEIIVSSDSCCVYALNSYGREKWRFKTQDSVYSIHCCDIDIDNRFEIVIGTRDDYVYVLDAEGRYEWKYKTDHNVWSIYSAPFSDQMKFCDLFAGLSNRMVYYYRLRDWRHYSHKIDECYTRILSTGKGEWEVLESFSKDEDEYLRQFAAQKLLTLSNGQPSTQNILVCLRSMLKDHSPRVRAAAVRSLVGLSEYNPDLVVRIFSTETFEQDETVRLRIIQGLSVIALNSPAKRGDIFNHLQRLSQQWEQIDRKAIINLFDVAQTEFITGNLNEAMIDFQFLANRGIDLVSKYKTDGYVCSLACGTMGPCGGSSVIAVASRNNHLYVFDHRGKLKWDRLTETYAQRIFIEDVDLDGCPEIVVGEANGTFQFFSEHGEEKGRFVFQTQMNDFSLVKNGYGKVDGLVIGTQEGMVYFFDSSWQEQWRFQTKTCVLSVYAEDIDRDGFPEIAVSTLHGHLFLLDQKGKMRWERNFQSDIRAISSLREETTDLIIGTRSWKIYAIDCRGTIRWLQSSDQVINRIWISQIHDSKRIVVATQGASLLVLDAKGNKTGKVETFSSVTALACADINRDGQKEIVLGTQDDYVYIYQFIDRQAVDAYIKRCKELSEIFGKKLSFPRNDILKLIKVNFESREKKDKVVLVGYLGSGKTNLLWQVGSGALGARYLPVYINLQYARLGSLADFVWDFAEKITKDLCRKGINPSCPSKSEFADNCLEVFRIFFKGIAAQLDEKVLLILLDDFDRLQSEVANENMSYDIFNLFEGMINTDKCYFVLTASSYDFDMERREGNSFLSNALIKDVNFVDRFSVQQELFRQLGEDLEDKEDAVNKILEITGSHAHYLQIAFNIISAYLERTKKNRLTNKDWADLYFRIMEAIEEELLNPWETFQAWEKVVLSSLARLNPYGATISDIKKNLGLFTPLVSSHHLANVLKDLTRKSILNEIFTDRDIHYNFTISVFRDWIKKKTNPFQVISENAEDILQEVPLRLFYHQHRSCQHRKQMDLFLQTIGLEFKQWKVLATLSQKWSRLIDRKGEINKTALLDFVRCFAKLLGFSVNEVLEYPRLSCFRFDTPALRLKKLAGMILAVPLTCKPDETDFQTLIGVIANLDAAPNTFMVLELEETCIFEKLVANSKLDLVLLDQERIKSIFLSENYLQALIDDVILRYVDFVDLSPYETMGPVDSMFFGRLEEIKTMRQLSHKSFAIIGARQLGKTSLMLKVRNLICHDAKIRTLFLDCSTYYDSLSLCQAIIDGVHPASANDKSLDQRGSYLIENLGDFKRTIHELCKNEGIKLALFLDEIDTLLAIDKEQNELLFKTFRALSQENAISLIVAGYEELFIRTKDIKSPLFNYLELIRLSCLDKRAAAQLVTEPIKELGIRLQDEKAIVEEICEISSCFPNLIQYICKRLIHLIASQRRRVIYPTDLAQVKKDPDFQDYLLSRFFTNLTPLGKAITLLLAGGRQEMTLSLVDEKLRQNNVYLSMQELSEEIDRLIIASAFSRTKQGLRFTLPYFSQILAQNMEKELLLKQLLREVYNGKSSATIKDHSL